jgi:hypothetical protein
VGGVLEKLGNVGKYGGKTFGKYRENIWKVWGKASSSIKSWKYDLFWGCYSTSKLAFLTNSLDN